MTLTVSRFGASHGSAGATVASAKTANSQKSRNLPTKTDTDIHPEKL